MALLTVTTTVVYECVAEKTGLVCYNENILPKNHHHFPNLCWAISACIYMYGNILNCGIIYKYEHKNNFMTDINDGLTRGFFTVGTIIKSC